MQNFKIDHSDIDATNYKRWLKKFYTKRIQRFDKFLQKMQRTNSLHLFPTEISPPKASVPSVINRMPFPKEEYPVNAKWHSSSKEIASDQPQKKRSYPSVQTNTSKMHYGAFYRPCKENRRHSITNHPKCSDRQSDRMQRPPKKTILAKGKDGVDRRSNWKKGEPPPVSTHRVV